MQIATLSAAESCEGEVEHQILPSQKSCGPELEIIRVLCPVNLHLTAVYICVGKYILTAYPIIFFFLLHMINLLRASSLTTDKCM